MRIRIIRFQYQIVHTYSPTTTSAARTVVVGDPGAVLQASTVEVVWEAWGARVRTSSGEEVWVAPDPRGAVRGLLDRVIEEAEKRARVRLLESTPEEIVEAIVTSRGGHGRADGGAVPNSYRYPATTTRLEVAWWRRGDTVHLFASAGRRPARRVPYGDDGMIRIRDEPSEEAMRRAAPERYEQLCALRRERMLLSLRRRGVACPPCLTPGAVQWFRLRDGRAALVWTHPTGEIYLCAPGAWRRLRRFFPTREPLSRSDLVRAGLPRELAIQLTRGTISAAELAAELVLLALEKD